MDKIFIERDHSTVGDLEAFWPLGSRRSRGRAHQNPENFQSAASDPLSSPHTDEFFSFTDAEFDEATKSFPLQHDFSGRAMPTSYVKAADVLTLPKKPRVNANLMSTFRWAEEIFASVAQGAAQDTARDKVRQRSATPLFVVAGTCPNKFSPLQAMTFFRFEDGTIDLWWVKPMKADASRLERETLNLQNSGPYKNDVGNQARALFMPLVDRYQNGGKVDGDFSFGIDAGRAFIEDLISKDRMLLYFVWQESWSGMMDRKKFIAGKLCYQRRSSGSAGHSRFFTRQYKIVGGDMHIAPKEEEEPLDALFPPDSTQSMYDMQV